MDVSYDGANNIIEYESESVRVQEKMCATAPHLLTLDTTVQYIPGAALPRALGRMLWLLGSLIWARDAQLHLPSTNDRVQLAPKTRCPTKYCGCHRVKKRHWVTKQLSCILH